MRGCAPFEFFDFKVFEMASQVVTNAEQECLLYLTGIFYLDP